MILKGLKDKSGVQAALEAVVDNRVTDARNPKRSRRTEPAREPFDHENNLTGDDADGGTHRDGSAPTSRGRAARGGTQPTGAAAPQTEPAGPSAPPRTIPAANTFASIFANASDSNEPILYREDGTRTVGLPGHLKTIEVIDFMCHHHMQMEFSPHVTFVSGSNGSGKSATLQALQCCLGVQARKTGRATSQKGFIRTGAHEAVVRVTVWNKPYAGKEAFQHEVYGDWITVERRISQSSASAWLLKDCRGRTVGRRREELDAMLSVLGINAANPVTVMTQDTARSFLAGSSHKADQDKYDLYMECTQLGTILENLVEAKQQIKEMDVSVRSIEDSYNKLEAERDEIKKKVDSLRGIEVWRNEQEDVSRTLAWVVVEEEEAEMERIEEELAQAPDTAATLAAQVEALQLEVAALEESVAQKKEFLNNFEANVGELGDQEKVTRTELRKLRARVQTLNKKVKQYEEYLQEEKSTKEGMEDALKAAENAVTEDSQAVQAEYMQQLEAANTSHRAAQAEVNRLKGLKDQAEGRQRDANDAVDSAKRAIQDREREVQSLERELQNMRAAKQNKAAAFGGPPMAKLVSLVREGVNRGQFHRAPIGPVGQYLEITDPCWGRAVEAALTYGMQTFLVQDQHDQQQLFRMFQSAGFAPNSRPQICVMRMELPQHNIPPHAQPRPDMTTVLRVLRVTDSSVEAPIMNFLVDQSNVEVLALVQTDDESKKAVRERNVKMAYDINGDKRYIRGQTESYEPLNQHFRNRPVQLGATVRDQTAELQANLQRAKAEVAAPREELRKAQMEADAAHAAAVEARKALSALQKTAREMQSTLELVQSQAPPEVLATQGDVLQGEQALQNDIFASTQRVFSLESKLDEAQRELEEAQGYVAEKESELKEILEKRNRLMAESNEFVSTFEAQMKQLGSKKTELADKQAETESNAAERAQKEQELEDAKQRVRTSIELAEGDVCSKEEGAAARATLIAGLNNPTPELISRYGTRTFLEKKFEQLNRKIVQAETQAGGTLAELEGRLRAAQAALDGEGARQKAVLELYKQLKAAYKRRYGKFEAVDFSVERSVSERFSQYMRRKGNHGKLKLERQEKRLTLSVTIGDKGTGSDKTRDLKQLSGGERSYTTVAFTLALGSTTEMPFRAMDEFDVFMDSVNRRAAMENLMMFAREQQDLQFIFLTPQDMAAVEEAKKGCARQKTIIPDDFVKIVAMKPARKNATQA